MPKLKIAQLAGICSAEGYTGDKNKPDEMKSWLSSSNVALQDDEGQAIDIKDIEIEDAPQKKVITFPKSGPVANPNKGSFDPEDPAFKSYMDARVNDRLRQLGLIDVQGRPVMKVPEQVAVKSADERMYENRIKTRQAFFCDYGTALLAKHFILSQSMPLWGRMDEAEKARKSFLDLHEKVAGKAYSTQDVTAGSALVPDAFIPDLIRNVTEAGVARKLAKVVDMPAEQVFIPRRTGGITGYFQVENVAPNQSNATYDNVTLNAKTFIMLAQASEQILQAGALSLIDLTFEEMGTSLAQMEDDCLFVGRGTSDHGNMIGFEFKYGLTAANTGQNVTGGADSTAHTAADLVNAIARVPYYARPNMVITIHHNLKPVIFDRLSQSTPGGLTLGEIAGYGLIQRWMNVPIIENNSLSSVAVASTTNRAGGFTAGDQIDFLIGDFRRAALFGDRMPVEMATSRERYFDQYAVGIRLVKRFHVNVHSVGDGTNAGPVVAFWQT